MMSCLTICYLDFFNPDFSVWIVARAKNLSETRSWSDFDPEAYHKYVEDQNRETSVVATVFKPQQMATAKSGFNTLMVNRGYDTVNAIHHQGLFRFYKK